MALETLTPRELAIARMVRHACSNKVIGHRLGITEQTVKNHLRRIFRKVGVQDRVSLTLVVIRDEIQSEIELISRAPDSVRTPRQLDCWLADQRAGGGGRCVRD